MNFIKPFGELGKEDASLAGGKGASLGEMTQAEIPVPPGFVLVADAFEQFLKETDLAQEIEAILHTVNREEMHTVEHASEKIQALILNANMPADIAGEVQKHFKGLGAKFVAVRSSATAEDSSAAAWAGQLDSYLNTTESTLLKNVQRCWASLFTPRAIFYRFEKNLHEQAISVAVVVQKMVASEVSGIAFSVHPVTEDRNQLIIEAGYGLGEAIVSGQVTPDSYVVEKEPRKIIDVNVNTQKRALYRAAQGGNEWRDIPEPKASAQVLTSEQVLELAELIVRIEQHYGFPCDIEWAYEKGKFYIIQSRPITTLKNAEVDTLTKKFLHSLGDEEIFKAEGDFLPLLLIVDWLNYHDENDQVKNLYPVLLFKNEDAAKVCWSLDKYRAISRLVFRKYLDGNFDLDALNQKYTDIRQTTDDFYKSYYLEQEKKEEELVAGLDKAHQLIRESVLHTLFLEALEKSVIEEVLTERGMKIDLSNVWRVSQILDSYSFHTKNKEDIIASYSKSPEFLQYVYSNYTHVASPDETRKKIAELDIEKLIVELKQNKKEVEDSVALKRQETLKLSEVEQKILAFINLTGYLRDDRKILITKCGVLLHNYISDLYKLWGYPQELVGVSIVMDVLKGKEHIEELLPVMRHRLSQTTILMTSADSYEEVSDESPNQLEAAYQRQHAPKDAKILHGESASVGFVRGKVRVITTKKDFDSFEEGEVLVAAMTRPEFVPLMKKAVAIVTDEGGITSHAAIVSRELRKPCVIGTRVATQVLKDGDEVEVDADNGVVRILSKQTENYVERILQTEWEHDWNGPFPLMDVSVASGCYFSALEKTTGRALPHILIFYKDGMASAHLPMKEQEELGARLAEKMQDISFTQKWVNEFKAAADIITSALGRPTDEFVNGLVDLTAPYSNYGSYQVSTKMAYNALPHTTPKEVKELLEEGRRYSETLYKETSTKFGEIAHTIAKQNPLYTSEQILMMTYTELLEYLAHQKLPLADVLTERRTCGVYWEKSGIHFISKEDVEAIERVWMQGITSDAINGTATFPGKVRGRCRILRTYKGAHLNQGEILVTGMTDPNFVPLMSKAGAIVTDGGGMLCHAAIVSRELKIPCVVGTKFATQILKDGDMVEVDANNGVVRVISK